MPWKIESAGDGKYNVIKEDTGEKKNKVPMSKYRAVQYLKALYVNTKEERKNG
jgi:hypothetical protein